MAYEKPSVGSKTSSMDSSFPVYFPQDAALGLSDDYFNQVVLDLLARSRTDSGAATNTKKLSKINIKDDDSKFINALKTAKVQPKRPDEPAGFKADNKMFTENAGVAHRSTKSAVLDLFVELERTIAAERLEELLDLA